MSAHSMSEHLVNRAEAERQYKRRQANTIQSLAETVGAKVVHCGEPGGNSNTAASSGKCAAPATSSARLRGSGNSHCLGFFGVTGQSAESVRAVAK